MKKSRDVTMTGPLGALIESGQIKKIGVQNRVSAIDDNYSIHDLYETKEGVHFKPDELIVVNPDECEPWVYANRQLSEMSGIPDLMESIDKRGQLQPVVITKHPKPHGKVKYQVIFGRCRYEACKRLKKGLTAILKPNLGIQEAIAIQNDENDKRKDVSPYSNALLLARLLKDGVFKTQDELAKALNKSKATISELLLFTKIPTSILEAVPNPTALTVTLVKAIYTLSSQNKEAEAVILKHASQLGNEINSVAKLEQLVNKTSSVKQKRTVGKSVEYTSKNGKKIFTFRYTEKGSPSLVLNKALFKNVELDDLCKRIHTLLEKEFEDIV